MPGPRNGRLPTDPYLVNGPVVNRTLLDQQFPPGRLLRNTGASWDNADRVVPYTDEITLGYERQLAANLAVSADYVRAIEPRPADADRPEPRAARDDGGDVAAGPAGQRDAGRGLRGRCARPIPGFANFTTGVTQPLNVGKLDYDALLLSVNKRFGHNYETRVSYTLSKSRGNTTGNGVAASGFQVLDDLHLELNEGPIQLRHAAQLRGQRPGGGPEDRRPQRELGGAGAERQRRSR